MTRVDIDNSAVERLLLDARRETLTDAAASLNERCQRNAPVDTGNLRRSHEIILPGGDATEAGVLASAPYSLYVHEGHRIIAFGRDTGRYQPADPWMRRSIDEAALGGRG